MRRNSRLTRLFPPLVLYGLLFFPDSGAFARLFEAGQHAAPLVFSARGAFAALVLFYLPAIAVCAAALRALPPARLSAGLGRPARQAKRRKALLAALDTLAILAALVALGAACFALPASAGRPFPAAPVRLAESGLADVCAACGLLCAAAALEELFFRRYLPAACAAARVLPFPATLLSTLLFALPHAWEGPFGILNALLAGLFLGAVSLRIRALLPLALAHGLYNLAALFAG